LDGIFGNHRMVTDAEIKKVIVVLDRTYAEKAASNREPSS